MIRCVLCLALLTTGCSLYAQLQDNFTPYARHSEQSRELIKMLEAQLDEEIQNFGDVNNRALIRRLCVKRIQFLIRQVKNRAFIRNDSLESFLGDMINHTAAASMLTQRPRRVLILNSQHANAFCYGRGLFIITVGLLGHVRSEEALAFILSHELAHDELRHVQEKILRSTEMNLARRTEAQARKILTGEVTLEELEEFRKLIYNISEYDREREITADSLGFEYYTRAGYEPQGAIQALYTLDSLKYPKHDAASFFRPLDFSKYRFQEYWLKKRLSIYSAQRSSTFMFSSDSLASHPDLALRRSRLEPLVKDEAPGTHRNADPRATKILALAEFQTAESAYLNAEYDQCLFQLLQLLPRYPKNRYLIARTTKLFVDLYEARTSNTFEFFVSKYTSGYGERLQQVNNVLYNLTLAETGEIAYHFINNQSNFNPAEESHYYLLWQICTLTSRDPVREKIEVTYKSRFNKKISAYVYR